MMQRVLLQSADQISNLIERPVAAIERTPHLGSRVIALVSDAVDEKVDALLGRHFLEVETERKNNARAAMHAPEERAHFIFRLLLETHVPKQKLQIKRVAFGPEGRAEQAAIRAITRGHETLKVVSRNQLMKDRGARERRIVAAHAHHLLFMSHGVGGIGNQNVFAAEEERTDELSFGRHHLHAPGVAREMMT